MKLEKCSLRSLTKHMELIARTYFEFKNGKKENLGLQDIEQDEFKHQQNQFVQKIQDTYDKLNPIEQLFINNDFFYESYPGWWKHMFTYMNYRFFKKKAIVHFMGLFYGDFD